MSAEQIRNALGLLRDDPDGAEVWAQLEDAVTSVEETAEAERLLEMARGQHEELRNWGVVARLLELEILLTNDEAVNAAKQFEQARVYNEELFDSTEALNAFRKALEYRDSDAARQAIEQLESAREKWEETVEKAVAEAMAAEEAAIQARMWVTAADGLVRYGDGEALDTAEEYLEKALQKNPTNRRALDLAEVVYAQKGEWEKLRVALHTKATSAGAREEKIAAALRLGHVCRRRLNDVERSIEAYQMVLDLNPANRDALSFLVDHYSENEQWDHLVALYEDQLSSGGVKQSDEFGVWVQIAMLNWKTRGRPEQARPYFEKVRRVDPTHAGMLKYFRDTCMATGETARLINILTDAQRALDDGDQKQRIAEEIATLAEGQENARRAIEQYKSILRSDPDNEEARDKLKNLYLQTESYNALVELYRQDLQRLPKDAVEPRVAVLRDIAEIYSERMKSDTALLTVLTQILQLDDADIDAVRQLTRVYESLGRWRDLLNTQQRLAELTPSKTERVNLLRAIARRWIEQFSNVQNAMGAYEALLEAAPGDAEAREHLRDLYQKRRAWSKLYELYDAELDSIQGEGRVELMMEMARLAAERLDRGNDAIRLLKEVLVFDPEAEGVLDALERQAERQKDFQTVAHVLERRVDEAEDDKTKLALLQKLGTLYADRLENSEATNRAWRRVLEVSPGHKRALRVLRQSYVGSADWGGLHDLYASQNDFEGLADFLSTTADRVEDDEQKIEVSFRAAKIYENELATPERAVRSYERVLTLDKDNVRAARALLPLYELEEKWSRLPGLYQTLLKSTTDVDRRIDILHKMADITGGPLANKTGALSYARQAYDERPDERGLLRLQQWSTQSGEWGAFIEVVRARLQDASLGEGQVRELRLMLAQVYAQEVEKVDEAVAMYRELVEADPTDAESVAALEALLRAADRRDDLRWLFTLKTDRFLGAERATSLEEWATVEEEVFGEPERAVALLERVLEAEPERASALGSLTRLYLAAQRFEDAAEVMGTHRRVAEAGERVELETKLARLHLEQLGQPEDAYDACLRALDIDDRNDDALAILERLMDVPVTRQRAAETLERMYAQLGEAEKQGAALTAMLESVADADQRLELCQRLADVKQSELDDPAGAFEVMLNTLIEFPQNMQLWDRAADLSGDAGRPTDMAQAYRQHLVPGGEHPCELDPGVQVELCERAAILHEEQLGDADGAVPYLQRMLALEPQSERAFERLKRILRTTERWEELEALFESAIEAAADPGHQVEMLEQMARTAEQTIGDEAKAIAFYERILAIDPLSEPATSALEKLYGSEERYGALAALLETRLSTCTDEEAVPIRLQLVDLYLHALEEHDRVMDHLDSVMRVHPNDVDARALAEECLEVPALRQPAAAMLDAVYEGRDDIRNLVRILEIRLEGAEEAEQRREILHRVATLRDDRLKDDAGAFESLCALMPLEPDDVTIRTRLLEVGHRLGRHEKMAEALVATAEATTVPPTRGEILMEAARLYRDRLEQTERAEQVYLQVVQIDENDPVLVLPATKALAAIYEERGDHAALANTLSTQVRLVEDPDQRSALYERIATLYEDVLENSEKAIAAWKARLEDNLTDAGALRALERLYEHTEAWRELVQVLHQLEQSSEDGAERQRCMVKSAEVLADRLGETAEAINAWRAVLDDFGPNPDTLDALAALYEKAARWEDLAEALDTWLSLSDDPDERVDLYAWLGDVRRLHLGDALGALAAYREVMTLDPSHQAGREALEAMLEMPDPEIKREAADIIGPLYEADGDAGRLLKVLNIEIESTYEPGAKLDTLRTALRTAEETLKDKNQAFDYARRGVREALGELGLREWIELAERLAAETSRWEDLMTLFEGVVDEMLDAEVQQDTRLRAGELARTRLEDDERAIVHYRAALEARTDDKRAMLALEELYEATDNAASLLEILQLRAEASVDGDDRVALLFRIAALQAGPIADDQAAIQSYEELLDVSLAPKAIEQLEALYTKAERHDDLIALYERQLAADADGTKNLASEAAAGLHVKIAEVAHGKLSDTPRALDELGEALDVDPMYEPAILALERILERAEEPEHRTQVAEILEPVYLGRAEWGKLKLVYVARLDTNQDQAERADLLRRLATLYEEQLEDYDAALDTTAKLLREDPADEDIWSEIERLGRVLGTEQRLADIFAEALAEVGADDPKTARLSERTGELYAAVDRHEDALTWYRRAYEFSPESPELFEAIDGLLVRLGRHEERVEHYRRLLENVFEDDARVRALHTIAALERTELGRPDAAASTLREILDVDESNEEALDALTGLYKAGDHAVELAELYERRAELQDSLGGGPAAAAPYRLELARLWIGSPDDRDRAIDQLQLIVDQVPDHAEAIAELEGLIADDERKLRVLDMLEPLYKDAQNWRGLVRIHEERLGTLDDAVDKVAVLGEIAELWEDAGEDPERAFAVVREAFELAPGEERTRESLERLAESLDAWEPLADSYQRAADQVEDDYVKRQLLDALATIADDELDDPRRALDALSRLAALDDADTELFERMAVLCVLLADWEALVGVLQRQAEASLDESKAAALWRRVGQLKHEMLDDEQGAVQCYERALEIRPDESDTLDRLIELYTQRDEPQRLVELIEQRIEQTSMDSDADAELRFRLIGRAARVHEERLESRAEAIRMWVIALEAWPEDDEVLSSLERLYEAERMHDALLDNLKAQAELAEEAERRVALRNKIGELYIYELGSMFDALEQYRLVLAEDPQNETAIASVTSIAKESEELRLDAALLLEPVLSEGRRFKELVEVLELRFTAQSDPVERAETLKAVAILHEEQLEQPENARDALLRAVVETPDDAALHDDIERLSELTDDFTRYADVLEQHAASVFDAIVVTDLFTRLGGVSERRLGAPERAIEAYQRAMEQAAPEDLPLLLEALDRLYAATANPKELARVLERRIDLADDDAARADLQHRLAVLQIHEFGEKEAGLGTLRMVVDVVPDHEGARKEIEALTDDESLFEEAAEALETVYRVTDDSAARARLRNKRIRYTPAAEERIRLRLELAQMLEEESFDTRSAQSVIEEAFADDITGAEVLEQLERLARTNAVADAASEGSESGDSAWKRAADAIVRAVDAALEAAEPAATAERARDLYLRAASWYIDNASAAAPAEAVLGKALEQDPRSGKALEQLESLQREEGREADLVATLRRLAELAEGEELARDPAQLRREAKTLAETALDDRALAEEILREMLAANDADTWALAELCEVCARKGDQEERYQLLVRRVELTTDADELRELRHEAAAVAADELGNAEAAVDLYDQAFEDDPTDAAASSALRALYQKLERHDDLLRILDKLVGGSSSPEERGELRLESAKICIDVLGAPTEGIEHLHAVLEEVPGHEGAVMLLSTHLEKEGRDDELAELLRKQIEVAKGKDDLDAELGFRVRLAELYETRLNEPDKAIEGYLGVLKTKASFRPALEALARLYEQQNDAQHAAETFDKLIDGASGEEAARLAMKACSLYLEIDNKESAADALEAVLEREGEPLAPAVAEELRDRLRNIYREAKAWDKLADLVTEEAELAADAAEKVVLFRRAAEIHAVERGDHAAAAQVLEAALKLQPDDRDLMLALCAEYTKSGRGDDAIAVLERLVESYGGRRSKELGDIHLRIASAHLANGDSDKALKELEMARKMDPGSIEVLYELGVLSIRLANETSDAAAKKKHTQRAANSFRSLLLQRLDGDGPVTKGEVFFRLAEVNQLEGDKKKAIQMLERALSNDKSLEKAQALLDELKA